MSGAESDLTDNCFHHSDLIEVRRVMNRGKGGRGVFARKNIDAGQVIERVPVILIPESQVFGADPIARRSARISWYVFEWLETKRGYVALSLGYGSIYNHSDTPNAAYEMEMPDIMIFRAKADIPTGAEIFIDYRGQRAGGANDLGFEPSGAPAGDSLTDRPDGP